MDFAWAVTDTTKPPPDKPEPFRGYFTDIKRAARRSLPKKPDKELCQLLGLSLVPAGNETNRAKVINDQLQETSADVENGAEPTGREESKQTVGEKVLSKLPCWKNRENDCTRREKIISTFAVYFAIVILILLVIVIILAAAVSAFSNNDDTNGSHILGSPEGRLSTPSPFTSTSLHTSLGSFKSYSTPSASTATQRDKNKTLTTTLMPTTSSSSATNNKTDITTSVKENVTLTTATKTVSSVVSSATTSAIRTTKSQSEVTNVATSKPVTNRNVSITTTLSSISTLTKTVQTVISSRTTDSMTESPRTSTTTASVSPNTEVTTNHSTTLVTASSTKSSLVTSRSTTSVSSSSTNPRSSTTMPLSKGTTLSTSSPGDAQFTNITTKVTTSSAITTTTTSPSTTAAPLPTLDKPLITCTTTKCQAARSTLDRVSFTKSPCEDFYKFACGGWMNETLDKQSDVNQKNVPSNLRGDFRKKLLKQIQVLLQAVFYDTDSLAERVTRRLYQSCLESNINGDTTLALQELREFLQDFRMDPDGTIQTDFNSLLSVARQQFDITPFFHVSTAVLDYGNNKKVFGIHISPPELFLEVEDYTNSTRRASLYQVRVPEVMQLYLTSFSSEGIPGVPGTGRKRSVRGRRQTDSSISYEELYLRVQKSFKIDVTIAKLIEETRTHSSGQKTVTIDELKNTYYNINWDQALGARSDQALIQVSNPDYFQAMNDAIEEFDADDLQLFVFLSVFIQQVWKYMPYPLRNMLRDVGTKNAVLYTEMDCVEITVELAPEESHALYVGQYTQDVLQNRLNAAMLENTVSETFKTLLSRTEWVGDDLSRVVSVFLSNLKLGFSPVKAYIRETEGIQGAQQSFLSLAVELLRQKHGYQRFLVTTEVTDNNIITDWTSSEIFYEDSLKLIAIPTGISVFIAHDDPPNFDFHGYIGFMLAKQIIKVMTGAMEGGVIPAWWGEININRFLPVKECFEGQQDLPTEIGKVIIGNGGFEIIHEVFRSQTPLHLEFVEDTTLTEEMLFLINTAQLECTVETNTQNILSVNSWMSNSRRFADIFSCPPQSPMVPRQQCHVFL